MADAGERERLMALAFAAMQRAQGSIGSAHTIALLDCQMLAAAALQQWASVEDSEGWPAAWLGEPG